MIKIDILPLIIVTCTAFIGIYLTTFYKRLAGTVSTRVKTKWLHRISQMITRDYVPRELIV